MKKATMIILSAAWLITTGVYAQQVITVYGKVTDSKGQPLEFVNVMLLAKPDSSLVKGTITDSKGSFALEKVGHGDYLVHFSQLGFEKHYVGFAFSGPDRIDGDIGTVTLNDNVTLLKGVDVVAKRSFIERHADKTVVNVDGSIVNAGNTALEVLQKSPGVLVDNNDNISLKGKTGVVILIDDKPTHMSDEDVAEMLKGMSSDQISKIEIMTNPPARYDASGNSGVINIVTRKDKSIGTNGSLRSSFGQGKTPDATAGISLNHRQSNVQLFGSYDYDWRKSREDLRITRKFSEEGDVTSVFEQHNVIDFLGKTHNYRAGADLLPNDKNTVGIMVRGMNSDNSRDGANTTEILDGAGMPVTHAVTANNSGAGWSDYNANLNWLHKFDTSGTRLTLDMDYAHFGRSNSQQFTSTSTDLVTGEITKGQLRSETPVDIDIKAVKADFEKQFSADTRFEAGVKVSYVVTDNNVKYYNIVDGVEVPDPSRSNQFKYTENINAAYTSIHTKYKGWAVQAGLRAEQSVTTGNQVTLDSMFRREYIRLFPTLYIERPLNEQHQLNFTFSRRYNRPTYQDLNPFRYFLDQYTYEEGNALLEPQFSYNFELTHTYKSLYAVTLNYSRTEGVITHVTKQIDSIYTTYITKENLNTLDNYGIAFSIPVQITKWWNSNNFINGYINHYRGTLEGGTLDSRKFSFNMNSTQSFQLPKGFSAELSGWYQSGMVYGIIDMDPMWSISVGGEKKLLDEKLSLRVLVNDIFYTSSFSGSTKYMNQDVQISSADDTRFVRVFVNYRFGKKTVQQARRRQTGVEEERGRVNRN